MTVCPSIEVVRELVSELIDGENAGEIQEWTNLPPIEFGVLSWHLGSFYFCFCVDEPAAIPMFCEPGSAAIEEFGWYESRIETR